VDRRKKKTTKKAARGSWGLLETSKKKLRISRREGPRVSGGGGLTGTRTIKSRAPAQSVKATPRISKQRCEPREEWTHS